MTKPIGNPRGRPRKRIGLPEKTAEFFRIAQDSQLPDGGDRRVLQCCEAIKRSMKVDVLAISDAVIWLEAVFMELEFRLHCENAEMNHALRKHKTALDMKGQRAQRCIMLIARAYESATGKRPAAPYLNKKSGMYDGPFLRFAKIIADSSRCPVLWPCENTSLKGMIWRALKLRDDPAQHEFEGLAKFNFLHGKRGAYFPREGDWLKWPDETPKP